MQYLPLFCGEKSGTWRVCCLLAFVEFVAGLETEYSALVIFFEGCCLVWLHTGATLASTWSSLFSWSRCSL